MNEEHFKKKCPDIPYYYYQHEPGILIAEDVAYEKGLLSDKPRGIATIFIKLSDIPENIELTADDVQLAYLDSYGCYSEPEDITETTVRNYENDQVLCDVWELESLAAQDEYERVMKVYTNKYYDWTSYITRLRNKYYDEYNQLLYFLNFGDDDERAEAQEKLKKLVDTIRAEYNAEEQEKWNEVVKACGGINNVNIERANFDDFLENLEE